MEKLSTKEQFEQLKLLTIRTGALHEAQVMQLKCWPLLIPGVKTAVISVDPIKHVVYYDLVPKNKIFKKTKMVMKFCKEIDKWSKVLLWNDTTVIIKAKDDVIHG